MAIDDQFWGDKNVVVEVAVMRSFYDVHLKTLSFFRFRFNLIWLLCQEANRNAFGDAIGVDVLTSNSRYISGWEEILNAGWMI